MANQNHLVKFVHLISLCEVVQKIFAVSFGCDYNHSRFLKEFLYGLFILSAIPIIASNNLVLVSNS